MTERDGGLMEDTQVMWEGSNKTRPLLLSDSVTFKNINLLKFDVKMHEGQDQTHIQECSGLA